jgi:hypothetical protein
VVAAETEERGKGVRLMRNKGGKGRGCVIMAETGEGEGRGRRETKAKG